MKNFIKMIPLLVIIFLLACSQTTMFPKSSVAPAADVSATKTKDKNGNFQIEFTVHNLASPERLTPSRKVYIVWIVAENPKLVSNVGQLIVKNAEPATLRTTTAYNPTEIFFTAEDHSAMRSPSGPEISRYVFNE